MRTARQRLTLVLLAAASVLGSAAINLATGPALFGIPHWVFSVALLLVAFGFAYLLFARAEPVSAELSHDDVLDRLAGAVDSRLVEELAVQDLHQAAPIAMRWRVDGRPGRVRLSGDASEIQQQVARRFKALRYRQVVVTGVAGAGKTVLAMWLTRGLNRLREPGDAVAVLVSVADWSPETEHLHIWLVRHLTTEYGMAEATANWLVSDRIIPVLDGFDELPKGVRAVALHGIHWARGADHPVVVTSRAEELDFARDGTSLLPNATVVDVEPVERTDATAFLRQGGEREHWDKVITHIETRLDSPLAQVLTTPLAVWLAKMIYTGRDPAELADTHRYDTAERLMGHLVTGLIPAAYRQAPAAPDAPTAARYDPGRAQHWLAFLARHLHQQGTTEFMWWRLYESISVWPLRVVTAMFFAVVTVVGSVPLLRAGHWGLVAELVLFGFIFGMVTSTRSQQRLGLRRFSVHGRIRKLLRQKGIALFLGIVVLVCLAAVVVVLGFVFVIFASNGTPARFTDEAFTAVVAVVLVSIPGVFAVMIAHGFNVTTTPPLDAVDDQPPSQMLGSDRRLMLALFAGVIAVAPVMLSGILLGEGVVQDTVEPSVVVVVSILVQSAMTNLCQSSSWYRYQATKLVLAVTGRLPWRLFRFLEDARRRGILRRSSAAYQFRHVLLQNHLAESAWHETPRSPS